MSRILLALAIEVVIAIPLIYYLEKLREKLGEYVILEWHYSHVELPIVRVLLILLFILAAYPALYGIEHLPNLSNVLLDHIRRIHSLINWLFPTSLVIPFIPIVGVIPALVIPIQSILATALLFNWATRELTEITIKLLPNIWILLVLIILSIATHKIAKMFAALVGKSTQEKFNQQDMNHLVYESSLLAFQAPAILAYRFYLGSQLKI